MRALARLTTPILALAATAPAFAAPNALILKETHAWGIPALESEMTAQGVSYTVVGATDFATENLSTYTMLFVASCQSDNVYDAWNARSGAIDSFVSAGGFLGIHGAVSACGEASGDRFPQPPGGDVTWVEELVGLGANVAPSDPINAGIPAAPTGAFLGYTTFSDTGNASDLPLINGPGNVVLFRRVHGTGNIVVGGLGYELAYGAGEDAGRVLVNEVRWGATVGCLPTDTDTDGDGVCDDNDLCEGYSDLADADGDGIPDDCDACPNSAVLNADSDGDGVDNSCDNCPGVANATQLDEDADGWGDACDNCLMDPNGDQFDWDGDGLGDVCDVCALGPNEVDSDGDGVPDACDACPHSAQDDSDGDGVCDSVDRCEGVDDSIDGDGDGAPDACDNCPELYNLPQNDRDEDGFGSGCDCDDRDASAFPGGVEVCDGADNDCNGSTDDLNGVPGLFYPDFDGDGVGEANVPPVEACEAPPNHADISGDCDDTDPARYAGAIEYCDDIDNDCDGTVDGVRCAALPRSCGGCHSAVVPGSSGFALLFGAALLGLRRRR